MEKMLNHIRKSRSLREGVGSDVLDIGYFANVVDVGEGVGIAISTDGVGSKVLIAQMLDKYDTVGIDCVAMNVNDVICVGAEALAFVDYIAVQVPRADLLDELGKGLYEGARRAKVTITGGEVSQLPSIVGGVREGYGFDLVGTCIGLVPLKNIIAGNRIEEGDSIIGIRSSGVHSNGLSLARKIFFEDMRVPPTRYFEELGRSIGEELLEPTHIYAPAVTALLASDIEVKALVNITGDGLLNLTRCASDCGYVIQSLPEPQPIFTLLQTAGSVDDAEMFKVFNMGIGFCVIVPPEHIAKTKDVIERAGFQSFEVGCTSREQPHTINILPKRLLGYNGVFRKY